MKNSKPGDNVPLDETLSIHIFNIGEGLDFLPLDEVVCADEESSLVPYSLGKGFHYIQVPLSE